MQCLEEISLLCCHVTKGTKFINERGSDKIVDAPLTHVLKRSIIGGQLCGCASDSAKQRWQACVSVTRDTGHYCADDCNECLLAINSGCKLGDGAAMGRVGIK